MVKLLHEDSIYKFRLYQTSVIDNNIQQFNYEARTYLKKYNKFFSKLNVDTTIGYKNYNLFQLTAGSKLFYNLYKDLQYVIFDYLGDMKPDLLYMQSWLNYHPYTEDNLILDWHNHLESFCHGYISIDPKNTTTEFENFKVENESGKIYIGPSGLNHRIVVKEPYVGSRITVAFDVRILPQSDETLNMSFIPLVR